MHDRVRLAIGGTAVVAVSAALVIAVAASNAVAFADRAGTTVRAAGVQVPSGAAASSTTTPASDAELSGAVPTPAAVPPAHPVPAPLTETVPAPDPVLVVPQSSASGVAAEEDSLIARAAQTEDWDQVWAYAQTRGWSRQRTLAWIESVQERLEDGHSAGSTDRKVATDRKIPADAHMQLRAPRMGAATTSVTTEKGQSRGTPDRDD